MQGFLQPSHSCLLSETDHWAGVCQIFIFIFPLLTVKTARRSVCHSKAKCFHLKYLGAKWIWFVQIMTLALTKKNWYWDTGDLPGFWGNLVDYNLVAIATQQQGKLQKLNIWKEVFYLVGCLKALYLSSFSLKKWDGGLELASTEAWGEDINDFQWLDASLNVVWCQRLLRNHYRRFLCSMINRWMWQNLEPHTPIQQSLFVPGTFDNTGELYF